MGLSGIFLRMQCWQSARLVDLAMDGKKGFEYAFGMCQTNLGVVGLWPSSSKNTKYKEIKAIVLFAVSFVIIIIFINIAQTTKLIMIWGDLTNMIDNISTANLPIAVVALKMIIFRIHKKELGRLLKDVVADWEAPKTKNEMKNMCRNASTAHKISFICVILGFGSVNGQLATRLSQEFDILPGPPEKRLPMVSSYFPYNYKISPVYEITWLMQYLGAGLATVVYSGVYCLFVALVLHLRGQVANLRLKLDGSDEDDLIYPRMKFRKRIVLIIERHQSLNRFAKKIERIFNIMFLAEILSCTVQICLQLFMLVSLLTENAESISFLQILFMMIYVMHVVTHVFICCYVADKLRDESLSICDSAYNFEWYNLPARDAKLLLMIMHRAEKPLEVTAGKFVKFSLRLYAQILKTSGGYLSMLLAVKERIPNDS